MTGALRRDLGLPGAVVTGLGSILGTGVFVSIAIAGGIAGRWLLLAAPLAGVVATFNGLSSAQLAAAHPVAGGTYEYGYRFLGPWWGFTAGWLFLVAKTASAATAALGFSGYLTSLAGIDPAWRTPLSMGAALAVTALVLGGIRRTAAVNATLVTLIIGALVTFVVAGLLAGAGSATGSGAGAPTPGMGEVLNATALLFVAYTGYGRIATLGEEVRDPERTIPRAVIVTLAVTALLYTSVAAVGGLLTAGRWSGAATRGGTGDVLAAPLAALLPGPWSRVVEIGAILAMLGVLLNLVLGLSRVWLAMGRRGDMPAGLGTVTTGGSPATAVVMTGALIAGVALVGDVRLTWSFSAFAVLLYYAVTNLAALRLPPELRRFPRWVSWAGLGSCGFLAFWVDWQALVAGTAVLALGLVWHALAGGGQRPRT